MDSALLWQVAAFLVAAGAVYGGIRRDLMNMHEKIESHDRAIERIRDRLDGVAGASLGRRRED